MKIYVAGKDPLRSGRLMRLLEADQHTITFDWTKIPTKEEARSCVNLMMQGVRECDLLILDGLQDGMLGAYVETGMALAWDKQVLVLNEGEKNSVFFDLIGVREVGYESELWDSIAELSGLAAR